MQQGLKNGPFAWMRVRAAGPKRWRGRSMRSIIGGADERRGAFRAHQAPATGIIAT